MICGIPRPSAPCNRATTSTQHCQHCCLFPFQCHATHPSLALDRTPAKFDQTSTRRSTSPYQTLTGRTAPRRHSGRVSSASLAIPTILTAAATGDDDESIFSMDARIAQLASLDNGNPQRTTQPHSHSSCSGENGAQRSRQERARETFSS